MHAYSCAAPFAAWRGLGQAIPAERSHACSRRPATVARAAGSGCRHHRTTDVLRVCTTNERAPPDPHREMGVLPHVRACSSARTRVPTLCVAAESDRRARPLPTGTAATRPASCAGGRRASRPPPQHGQSHRLQDVRSRTHHTDQSIDQHVQRMPRAVMAITYRAGPLGRRSAACQESCWRSHAG